MCGNFGLLLLNQSNTEKETTRKNSVTSSSLELKKSIVDTKKDDLDRSIDRSMHEVSATHGILLADEVGRNSHTNNETIYVGRSDSGSSTTSKSQPKKPTLLPAIKILESQTAATEIRGGQAGLANMSIIPCIAQFLRNHGYQVALVHLNINVNKPQVILSLDSVLGPCMKRLSRHEFVVSQENVIH